MNSTFVLLTHGTFAYLPPVGVPGLARRFARVLTFRLDNREACWRRRKAARPKRIEHEDNPLRGVPNLDALDRVAARMGVAQWPATRWGIGGRSLWATQ